jgi:hypothetical protein
MLRRLSVLGALLLAACVPQGPGAGSSSTAACSTKVPTKAEAMAWRSAKRVNTAKSYRGFINSYPRSCYVPAATNRLGAVVTKKPVVVRNVPKSNDKRIAPAGSY